MSVSTLPSSLMRLADEPVRYLENFFLVYTKSRARTMGSRRARQVPLRQGTNVSAFSQSPRVECFFGIGT